MSRKYVFLNGQIVDADAAVVSVFDVGFTHAAGLFETFRSYRSQVFRLDTHLKRLADSARVLSLAVPVDAALLKEGVARVLRANELLDARIRLTVTAGSPRRDAPDGGAPGGTVLIAASPFAPQPANVYEQGLTVCISAHKQTRYSPIAGHKTLGYLPRLIALREAQAKGCGEALWFTTENLLAEACHSNVFLVKEGRLLTPPFDTPVLPGVTRGVVLELARANEIECEEKPLTIDDLLSADEVFLTGSALELMPVARIERHAVGAEKRGAVTTRMAELYRALVARETGAGARL